MEYDIAIAEKIAKEMIDLVFKCKIRTQNIEDLIKAFGSLKIPFVSK